MKLGGTAVLASSTASSENRFTRNAVTLSPALTEFTDACRQSARSHIRCTRLDSLLGRSLQEKIENYCHVQGIRKFGVANFKRQGRWAFRPFAGCTEFFSALFSLECLILNAYHYTRLVFPRIHRSPMRSLLIFQYVVCNLTLLSSCLFHACETRFSRYADYFCACLSILAGLVVVINRLVVYYAPRWLSGAKRFTVFLGSVFFAYHLRRMLFVEFDYAYNKIVCGTMFVLACFGDSVVHWRFKNTAHGRSGMCYTVCLLTAGGVEIMDIPPLWFLFDSHAVWHLLMALAVPFYVYYVAGDIDAAAEHLKSLSEAAEMEIPADPVAIPAQPQAIPVAA